MKKIVLMLVALVLLFSATAVFAADVHMSVEVVAKKPTDTINDFDFSTVNTTYYETGRVAGASTNVLAENLKWCPA